MRVTLTSPVEGKQPGDTVTVDNDRGDWLIWQGYATASSDKAQPDEPADTAPVKKTTSKTPRKP